MPFATYCIATYRRPELLRATLVSILGQRATDLEVVVSDNDPAGSAQVVLQDLADPRLRYTRNRENVGMVRNFNNALAHATGDFIVFITDDDPVSEDHLETLMKLRQEWPGHAVYFGVGSMCLKDARIARLLRQPLGPAPVATTGTAAFHPGQDFVTELLTGQLHRYVLWSCGMVRADVARRFGMPDYGTPFFTDFAYVALVGGTEGCVLVDRLLGWQTVHPGNFGRETFADLVAGTQAFVSLLGAQWPGNTRIHDAARHFVRGWCLDHFVFLFRYLRTWDQKLQVARAAAALANRGRFNGFFRRFITRLLNAYWKDLRIFLKLRPPA